MVNPGIWGHFLDFHVFRLTCVKKLGPTEQRLLEQENICGAGKCRRWHLQQSKEGSEQE